MGAKNLVMLKTHFESINICFFNDVVYGNMLWALSSLRVFFFNYVLYSFGLILRYIFRFQVVHQSDRNGIQDSEVDGLPEELPNLLFTSSEYFHVADDTERETECSVFVETTAYDVAEDSKSGKEGKTESSVLMETDSNIHNHEDGKEGVGEEEYHDSKEKVSDIHEDGMKIEGEKEGIFFMETFSNVHEDVKKKYENERKCSVFMEGDFSVHQHGGKRVEKEKEEEAKGVVIMDTDSSISTSACQFVSGKDISVFMEEPSTMTFSFLEFYKAPNVSSVSDNVFTSAQNIGNKEFSEGFVPQEEKESAQEQICFSSSSTSGRFCFESEAEVCGGSDSDSDYIIYNDNSLPTDSESESSNNSCEGFEYTSVREKECSNHGGEETCIDDLERTEETKWEDKLDEYEMDCDEEDEDDYEWEHDEVVQQLRLELRNARQGGLATILEEEEEEEEKESPKVVEDLKPLKIEEKLEYKDHIVEIHKVYKCYAEKMRKLDILNYQTMHAIGLLQLKDPLKLILTPKSTVQGAKLSHNLWPRKAPKHISEPMLKFVNELHRDLELVYVGQVCLSWEILCWQHKKSQEVEQYDSEWPRRYNLVAGEFQFFQVLMQRFIENEPFQGPRIQNYANNRCVVRNLLQVPIIKDDNMKDKKKTKWGADEDAITSGRLAEIIKESMRVFYEFVRADKGSQQNIGSDVNDPEISDLVVDVRTQLHKRERKLKEILRSGNCIVRRFQKHHEDQVQLDHEQLLAQVGLRLISRVLNMKKLRKDKLIWCNEKLNRIKFVGRKIQVDPSFLLFPC